MWHAALPVLHEGWRTTSAWDEPWEVTVLDGFPAGAMHKTLRLPDAAAGAAHGAANGFVRLVMPGPGWLSLDKEKHRCWEENILLRGDMLMPMPGRGVLRPGVNLSNPVDFWHGPMATKGGALPRALRRADGRRLPPPPRDGRGAAPLPGGGTLGVSGCPCPGPSRRRACR